MTWLVTKEGFASKAKEIFAINITSKGLPYLGAPIGISAYCEAFISAKVTSCMVFGVAACSSHKSLKVILTTYP